MDEAAALALVERALAPGETLLWWESAPAGPLRTLAVAGAIFFVVLAAGFVVLTGKALRSGGLVQRGTLGLVLALLIAGEVVSVQGIFAADSTVYALTDARVMIVSGEPELSVRSYADVQGLKRDGDQLTFRYGISPHQGAVTLWGLDDPDEVATLIQEQRLGEP